MNENPFNTKKYFVMLNQIKVTWSMKRLSIRKVADGFQQIGFTYAVLSAKNIAPSIEGAMKIVVISKTR